MIQFTNMLHRYSVPCSLVRKNGQWNEDGEFKKQPTDPISLQLAILPIDAKMMQLAGGRYTMEDKAIYSTQPLIIGDQIKYKGGTFTIDHEVDYSEYADFKKYMVKRVSTHG
ncbi:hypothetical protein JNUCC42_13230 [Brevibacterium sp. JNUCC-42]|nr:hypothetical protein JNUCC42_13230 [Brevibacterium sp. JNUCC-42]